jgi:hypothetical protein
MCPKSIIPAHTLPLGGSLEPASPPPGPFRRTHSQAFPLGLVARRDKVGFRTLTEVRLISLTLTETNLNQRKLSSMTQMGYAPGLILRYAHTTAALGFAARTGWEVGTSIELTRRSPRQR